MTSRNFTLSLVSNAPLSAPAFVTTVQGTSNRTVSLSAPDYLLPEMVVISGADCINGSVSEAVDGRHTLEFYCDVPPSPSATVISTAANDGGERPG